MTAICSITCSLASDGERVWKRRGLAYYRAIHRSPSYTLWHGVVYESIYICIDNTYRDAHMLVGRNYTQIAGSTRGYTWGGARDRY